MFRAVGLFLNKTLVCREELGFASFLLTTCACKVKSNLLTFYNLISTFKPEPSSSTKVFGSQSRPSNKIKYVMYSMFQMASIRILNGPPRGLGQWDSISRSSDITKNFWWLAEVLYWFIQKTLFTVRWDRTDLRPDWTEPWKLGKLEKKAECSNLDGGDLWWSYSDTMLKAMMDGSHYQTSQKWLPWFCHSTHRLAMKTEQYWGQSSTWVCCQQFWMAAIAVNHNNGCQALLFKIDLFAYNINQTQSST